MASGAYWSCCSRMVVHDCGADRKAGSGGGGSNVASNRWRRLKSTAPWLDRTGPHKDIERSAVDLTSLRREADLEWDGAGWGGMGWDGVG